MTPAPRAPTRVRHYACVHPETYKYFFAKEDVVGVWRRLAASYGEPVVRAGFGVMEIQSEALILRATTGGNPITVIRTRRCTKRDVDTLHRVLGFAVDPPDNEEV